MSSSTNSGREQRGRFALEVRERAVRLVQEHLPHDPSQWAAITAIAPKLGCTPGDAAPLGA